MDNYMPDIIFASDNNVEFPGLWVREDGSCETFIDTKYIKYDIYTALLSVAQDMAGNLDLAMNEIGWWIKEHGCCAGHEEEVVKKCKTALQSYNKLMEGK